MDNFISDHIHFENALGGIKVSHNGEHVGWVVRAQDRKWSYILRNVDEKAPLFPSEAEAKAALETVVMNGGRL